MYSTKLKGSSLYQVMNHKPIIAVAGFTLSELLTVLAVLAIIVTFTIPKVLSSQQNSKYNSAAKETMAMLSQAMQLYKNDNTLSSTTRPSNLTTYMNYVKVDNTSDIDDNPNDADSLACAGQGCLKLHSGGILWYPTANGWGNKLGGTSTTNAFYFQLDPDGLNLNPSSADGPGKGLEIWVYSTGRVTTVKNITSNSCNIDFCQGPLANGDPSWFSW